MDDYKENWMALFYSITHKKSNVDMEKVVHHLRGPNRKIKIILDKSPQNAKIRTQDIEI